MTSAPNRPILLCGMMGSGKSTIARTLARQLNRPWTDLDRAIERTTGCSIPELFKREGEETFRKKEREELERAIQSSSAVIALGGGALQSQKVVDRVREAGWLIFLDAPQSVLLERLGKKTGRPLIDSLSRDELRLKLDTLFAQRERFYRQAHITIPVDQQTPAQVARRITEQIQSMPQ